MRKWLIRHTVKNYQNLEDSTVRRAYGVVASIFGVISNALICILKITVGLLFGLISFVADGINNLADAASSVVALIGFKLSSKPADKDHPYGHERMEYIAGFMVSMFVCVLGVQLILSSVDTIFANTAPIKNLNYLLISSAVLGISILVKIYQAYFNYQTGKQIHSLTLKATATDSRNDVVATSFVWIGLLLSYFLQWNLDGYFGAVVGLFIVISGIKLVIETANPLLGQKPDDSLIEALVQTIKKHSDILSIHDLQIHSYGPRRYFASCHVEMDARIDVIIAHDLIDNIEKECLEVLSVQTVLHYDPVVIDDPLTNKIKEEVETILRQFAFPLTMHDFRIVNGPTHINLVFDIIVPQKKPMCDAAIVESLKEKIAQLNPTYRTVIQVDQDISDFLSRTEDCE